MFIEWEVGRKQDGLPKPRMNRDSAFARSGSLSPLTISSMMCFFKPSITELFPITLVMDAVGRRISAAASMTVPLHTYRGTQWQRLDSDLLWLHQSTSVYM